MKSPVLLLVNDSRADRELTRRALQENVMRVDLRVVEDGEQAMDYLLHRGSFTDRLISPRPDLVLLDLNMPRMDGREVLSQARSNPRLDSIPIVVLTTSNHAEDIQKCYQLGCNSFITMPGDFEGFVKVVRGIGSYWFELASLPSSTN